jgi:glycosyltransferase involved in cell wall biosynthesis
MHLGLIIYDGLESLTGGYIYDRILVDYLREHGCRVEIISLAPHNYSRHLLDSFSPELRSNLINSGYDVLLQDELNHPSLGRINHILQRKANFPIVAIVHQVLCRQPRSRLLNRIYRSVETYYLKSVDAFIFNSDTTRQTVEALLKRRRSSIVASPAGNRLGQLPSFDLIGSRSLMDGPLSLLFVGNVLPHKGLAPLIKGLSNLSSAVWQLSIVGSLTMNPSHTRRIRKLIDQLNLSRQVDLAGPKDGSQLASHFARSHVFIMPYSQEGFGMAHLEAMAFALPVIGSSTGAVKEFVIPGQNGFLIEPGDHKILNHCINRLHRNRQILIKMSRAALQTFKSRPNWHDTMEAIHGFLKRQVMLKNHAD